MARDDRGGLARSSDEFRETGRSEGANMLSFKIIHNLKRNDELLRNKITANNKLMVWQAYWKVRANKGGAGVDEMDWDTIDCLTPINFSWGS